MPRDRFSPSTGESRPRCTHPTVPVGPPLDRLYLMKPMLVSLRNSRSAPAGRLLRIVPAALAAFELRYLLTHLFTLASGASAIHVHGARSLLVPLLVALATGLLLRECARGLPSRVSSVRWSKGLLRTWLLCSVGLGAALATVTALGTIGVGAHADTLVRAIGLGGWPAAGCALLVAGLLLALSLHGARWLLARVRAALVLGRRPLVPLGRPGLILGFSVAGAPLRAGWSDRGPPSGSLAIN